MPPEFDSPTSSESLTPIPPEIQSQNAPPTHPESLQPWPPLPFEDWRDTCATLHLRLQIVGKVRLAQSPWINHSWHATLYPTASGLTTSAIPYGDRSFEILCDFLRDEIRIQSSDGRATGFPLEAQSVADFHRRMQDALAELDLDIAFHGRPNEIPDAVPFDQDDAARVYDREYVARFWRVLLQVQRIFTEFRAGFIGKCSPVHLFWGALDLAVTRFSGREAPIHPGGVPGLPDPVTREAYSHEVCSCGFWPGGGPIPYPAFYSYAYPEPPGFSEAAVEPAEAFYSNDLREFILPYDAVRTADTPDQMLLSFLQSTYEAAADLGGWDRAAFDRLPPPNGGPPR